MSDQTAFMRAICTDPDDDTPRLVFADWLDEHDEAKRAAFIRLQIDTARKWSGCKYSKLDTCHDRRKNNAEVLKSGCARCKVRARLIEREKRLIQGHYAEWAGEAFLASGSPVFQRGFVESLSCSANSWLANAERVYWHPRQTMNCRECGGIGAALVFTDYGPPHEYECETCKGTGRLDRPFPETALPLRAVRLTTWPRLFRYDNGLRIFHLGARWQRQQFSDLIGQPYTEHEVIERLLVAEWPGIKFTIEEPAII